VPFAVVAYPAAQLPQSFTPLHPRQLEIVQKKQTVWLLRRNNRLLVTQDMHVVMELQLVQLAMLHEVHCPVISGKRPI
jgi:hypothetical protein